MEIKCKLNVIFAENGIKKSEFAKQIGVNNGTISSWVSNESIPKLDVAYRVADELNMPVEKIWVRFWPEGYGTTE